VRLFRFKRRVLLIAVLLLTLLFLARPGANRVKTRVVNSISLALGRPVDVASVRVRLLPQPGFELENFVIHDDPTFGAEPMLRAQEVAASLRLTSLIRGRLEISRLDFVEPSLNLVRRPEGLWNFGNLVERAQKVSVAPTAKVKTDKRPGFPYIACSGGRINFKFGQEKKPYALTDADFSLWQQSENEWAIRLRARPVRSDFNLSDTGVLQVSGSWQRAITLRDTPLHLVIEWDGAQLGQLSKLAYGNDKGWRGAIQLSATLAGTAANSALTADASVEDFRRYNVITADRLRVQTRCTARYSSGDNTFSDIICHAPAGEGTIGFSGTVRNLLSAPAYDLAVTLQQVPIQLMLTLARHAHPGLRDDLSVQGQVDGEFRGQLTSGANRSLWEGRGETSEFHLTSAHSGTEIVLGVVPFGISAKHANPSARSSAQKNALPMESRLDIGPIRAAFGKAAPLTVEGWVGREGYEFDFHGEAQLKRLLEAARMVAITPPAPNAEGSAKVDLQLADEWSGLEPPRVVGNAQLHGVRTQVRGFNAPLEIAAASLTLTRDEVKVQNLVASAAGASWRGSLLIARPCVSTELCTVHFNLHADEIALDRLNQLLNPTAKIEPWYRALSSSLSSGTPYLMTVNASGKINVDHMVLDKLKASSVTADVELKKGKLRASALGANLLGGHHDGEWQADFTAQPPQYRGSGIFQRVQLEQLAEAMNGDWITGTANVSYQASTSGITSSELFSSTTAHLQIDASDGALPHLMLAATGVPLQMRHLAARLLLQDGKIDVRTGQIETGAEVFHLSGSASLMQILDLQLTRDDASGFSITGTLSQPRVSQLAPSETRAALKP